MAGTPLEGQALSDAQILTLGRPGGQAVEVTRVLLAPVLVLAASLACTGVPGEREWAGSVRDSAGVTLVTNPEEGLWDSQEAWTVREDLRIGEFGGNANYQFGQVGAIAVNSRGEIVVVDRQLRELRFYSPAGDFIRAVGEPGTGPGEFGVGVGDVFVGPDDGVLIPDVRNRRVHRYTPDGELLGSASLDMERYRPLRFKWNAAARRAAVQLRPTGVLSDDDAVTTDELRLLEPTGELGDVLLRVPSGELLGPNVTRYFTPEPSWALSDSLTILYAVNSEYRIGSYDRSGQLTRVLSKAHEPRPITDRDIRAFFAYLDQAWLEAGVPPSRLEANHRRVSFAEVFPAFAFFNTGPAGSLWVQPIRAPGELTDAEIERYNFLEDFGDSDWDVFDDAGRFLGVVTMPPRFQPRIFVGDAIYGVARDEADVQYVVRLRIEMATGDGAPDRFGTPQGRPGDRRPKSDDPADS